MSAEQKDDPRTRVNWELGYKSQIWAGLSREYAVKAAEAEANGDLPLAENYRHLVRLSSQDALQAAVEANQVRTNRKRDGLIPTITLDTNDPFNPKQ